MKFISNYTYKLVLFIFCVTIVYSCRTVKEGKESKSEISLSKDCLSSLNLGDYQVSEEYVLIVKQFLSKNECGKEALDFSRKALKALNDGTIRQISLECLNKYFDMSEKSPFGISFGGVFSCEY
ncbi:hypothetical protein DFQ05_1537 [Winogradskyella wandonensis]|uniref:Lipoprotein n=1 Tax=Winogradskyella wandonensis TaxID=1442586 RepID=A0A4R1KRS9_9FLAO|nr:hypothetical protein [Winogradskyella wandonensis]TCK67756.1 hypothetical protein DFQ05_1537 [Winogradskyella wandonensis]